MKNVSLADWNAMNEKQRLVYLAEAKRPAVRMGDYYNPALNKKVYCYRATIRGIVVSYQGVTSFTSRRDAYNAGKARLAEIQQLAAS